jgi:predicted metal-dependent peptidase
MSVSISNPGITSLLKRVSPRPIVVAFDVSGAVQREAVGRTARDVLAALEENGEESVLFLTFDSQIKISFHGKVGTDVAKLGERLLSHIGPGGTNFKPVLDYAVGNTARAVIILTDLFDRRAFKEVYEFPILVMDYSLKALGEA